MIESTWVSKNLPEREANSNKGTFGKLLLITGSERYRGAAHLTVEAALRSGVGLVTYLGAPSVVSELSVKYPEVIYKQQPIGDTLSDSDIAEICALSRSHSATLIGSGSDNTDGLGRLTLALLASEGSPLILDADAINALSTMGEEGVLALKKSPRTVIITPHPLEFARLSMSDVAAIQLHRLEVAERFAVENNIVLVLKGAGTIIADNDDVYINVTGSSALAKAGSGDVLAGVLASFVAQGKQKPAAASALAVYLHAVAGQRLAGVFSDYGVTPSDLPKEIARTISDLLTSGGEII
jgi:NAD(P)H-hydrate epimerase